MGKYDNETLGRQIRESFRAAFNPNRAEGEYAFLGLEDLKQQLALGAGDLAVSRAIKAYAKPILKGPTTPSPLYTALRKKVLASGVRLNEANTECSVGPFVVNAGPHYNPKTHQIAVGKNRSATVLAHEFGHSQGGIPGKLLKHPALRVPANIGQQGTNILANTLVGALGQHVSTDNIRNLGLASMAFSVPTLVEELRASARGAKALRSLGASRMKALGAFKGVPTYVASSGMAMLPWAVRKLRGERKPKGVLDRLAEKFNLGNK